MTDSLGALVYLVREGRVRALTVVEYCALPGSAVADTRAFFQRAEADAFAASQVVRQCGEHEPLNLPGLAKCDGCGHAVQMSRDLSCPACGGETLCFSFGGVR